MTSLLLKFGGCYLTNNTVTNFKICRKATIVSFALPPPPSWIPQCNPTQTPLKPKTKPMQKCCPCIKIQSCYTQRLQSWGERKQHESNANVGKCIDKFFISLIFTLFLQWVCVWVVSPIKNFPKHYADT